MIEPFEILVPDSVLEDLAERLRRARIPDDIASPDWSAGTPAAYLRELVEYWRDEYDWRSEERRLNAFAHFRTVLDGQVVHFIHERSSNPNAIPLLLTHGWPGSVVEFLDVIPQLVAPERFGGSPDDAFDVIAPSLPGYGFSCPLAGAGWDVARIADAFGELVHRLGYERYLAQGGDWGAQVATRLGSHDPRCVALHLNMPLAKRPDEPVELDDADRTDARAISRFQRAESAYAMVQSTKPQTLGSALGDSPVGLAAWIIEKFRSWGDCDGIPENVFTRDQLLTNVMVYWVTQTITSSMWLYREHQLSAAQQEYVRVPTGVARFPKEILRFPKVWVERHYNVTHWTEPARGGHFAAMEQPQLFVDDVRAFARSIR